MNSWAYFRLRRKLRLCWGSVPFRNRIPVVAPLLQSLAQGRCSPGGHGLYPREGFCATKLRKQIREPFFIVHRLCELCQTAMQITCCRCLVLRVYSVRAHCRAYAEAVPARSLFPARRKNALRLQWLHCVLGIADIVRRTDVIRAICGLRGLTRKHAGSIERAGRNLC
jgi:hypothetical protein